MYIELKSVRLANFLEKLKKGYLCSLFYFFLFAMSGYMRAMECEQDRQRQVPTLNELSLDEKIGQLIMMATVSSPKQNQAFIENNTYAISPSWADRMIQEYYIGGVIFLGAGSPESQIAAVQRLQSLSKHFLLVGLDAEWGLSMRHKENVVTFPHAMTLGALSPEDEDLIYKLGQEVGRQCADVGVHINFAPVADVNNNPRNPIINTRSFGERPEAVARKAELFMKGMQSVGIMSCAKHFPGHGDTETDSHHARGVITHDEKRLHEIELAPFKYLINQNVASVMTAHLDVPALSKDEAVPATLSRNIITTLLREQLGFEGLIITDGLGMKGITNDFKLGELELQALKAGNDILLCPVDVPLAIKCIKQAVYDGELSEEAIDEHVERILNAKRKVMAAAVQLNAARLCAPEVFYLKKNLYRAAVTIARDSVHAIPLKPHKKVIIKTFGESEPFIKALKEKRDLEHKALAINESQEELNEYDFDESTQVVISIHLKGWSGMIEMQSSKNKEHPAYIDFIKKHAKKIIVVLFGNPYNLEYFSDIPTIVVGYENEPEAQQSVAEVLTGLHSATGTLPVTPSGW